MKGPPFEENLERDAKIVIAQIKFGFTLSQIAPFVMQMPGFEGGPDRLLEYAKWIADPKRKTYRGKVVEFIETNRKGHR